MSLFGEPAAHECSRAGCREGAEWRLDWSNPRIHTDGRTKTWLACGDHREFLYGFLSSRGFPVSVTPLSQGRGSQPPARSAG